MPAERLYHFEVSVSLATDAETPEEAIDQMIAFLDDYRAEAGYRVANLDTRESVFIDRGEGA